MNDYIKMMSVSTEKGNDISTGSGKTEISINDFISDINNMSADEINNIDNISDYFKNFTVTDKPVDLNSLFMCDIPEVYDITSDKFIPVDVNGKDIDTVDLLNDSSLLNNIIEELTDVPIPKTEVEDPSGNKIKIGNDSNNDTSETVIIEMGADNTTDEHVNYKWNVKPGDVITNDTILAYCDAKNHKMLPVRSIFKSGVVREDPDDHKFGKLFKTVCSRHIIIDNAVKGERYIGGDTYTDVMTDSSMSLFTEGISDAFQNAQDSWYIVTSWMPYLMYLKQITRNKKEKYKENTILPFYRRTEAEHVFSEYINNDYIKKLKEPFEEDLKNLDSADNIKATRGNYTKLKSIVNDILARRTKYFNDVVSLCDNYNNLMDTVDCYDASQNTYEFAFDMDFKWTKVDENGYITEIKPYSDSSMYLREYYANMSDCILPSSKVCTDFKELLNTFATERNLDSSLRIDQTEQLESEISRLDDFIANCKNRFINDSIMSLDSSDIWIQKITQMFPDVVEWPDEDDIQFNNIDYKLYTFTRKDDIDTSINDTDDGEDLVSDDFQIPKIDDLKTDPDNYTPILPPDYKELYDEKEDPQTDMDNGPTEVDMSSLKYWIRYLSLATVMTIPYLQVGLYPPPIPVYLPGIYTPIKVVYIKPLSLICVIGIAVRGISVNVLTIFVNTNQQDLSSNIVTSIMLNTITNNFKKNINKLKNISINLATAMKISLKNNNEAMLRQNKEFDAQIAAIDALQIPSMNQIIQDMKKNLGQDVRQYVSRLEDDSKSAINNIKDDVSEIKMDI